ncbi:MAG: glycosyltransferase family 2 protein [Solirubrobacterales bacterium]|nr:glycosyltransferase family 2 protein [Solirubrobacterales bacterium]
MSSATPKVRDAGYLDEATDTPLLEVIVVNSTGGRELVAACLRSLERHPLRQGPMSVWVVDNASADGAAAMVRSEFPWVRLEALSWNAGFCIANNVAMRASTAPFVLLLNPDTEVYEGSLDHMIDLMREREDVGMAGCRLVLRDGRFDHAAKRSFPTPVSALAHFVGVGGRGRAPRRFAQYRAPEVGEHEAGEVDAVNGAFMLVRRPALEQVGLLDEAYWLYMEDLDWCYRFRQAGWRVWYDGTVSVLHVKGGTTVYERERKRHRGLRHNLAFHRSMGRFYRKFYAGRSAAQDVAIYLAIGVKVSIAAVRSTVARRSVL